jgi:hypothetical protein
MSSTAAIVSRETLVEVLKRFPVLTGVAPEDLKPATGGLINETFLIAERYVLQRLHPIFGCLVNNDISELGDVLRRKGVAVPAVIPAFDGRNWTEVDGVWRVLSYLPGRTLHQLSNVNQARSAGRLVGKFHQALRAEEHTFSFSRGAFHDTSSHMKTLEEALSEHPNHRLMDRVGPLAEGILGVWSAMERPTDLPPLICHGDLKVSNLRFQVGGDKALSLLDMDTMTVGTLDAELGDAFRSWCNMAAEHDPEPRWDLDLFEEAWKGYAEMAGERLSLQERQSIVPGTTRIILELSARFATDALRESYFGFDRDVAPSRGEHNLLRAQSQFALVQIVLDNQAVMEKLVLD